MFFRPLSKNMIQKLRECYRIDEYSDGKPCTMENLSYQMGPLYKRGMIELRKNKVGNKTLQYIHLTQTGKDFLENLKEENSN